MNLEKLADVVTPLEPHQQRVADKLKASKGLLVAHGLGSGKTLSSIHAAESLGLPIEAIVPAPLIKNYEKELKKHLDHPRDARIRSYEKAVRDKDINPNALVVLDEAHRARNMNTAIAQEIARRAATAKARLLLTGTPIYNSPTDLASLLNTAAGKEIVPGNPSEFKQKYIGHENIPVPLLTRLKGHLIGKPIQPATQKTLINRQKLIDAAKGYVDVHSGQGEDFPSVQEELHQVPMSPKQWEMYHFHEGKLPWPIQTKIHYGLPLSKAESKDLNPFQAALRQVSNTPRPYIRDMTDEQELDQTPKIQKMVEHLQEMRAKDPQHRGVLYSNFLEGGLQPLSRALTQSNIPHSLFTGDIGPRERNRMVEEYNQGKTPVMLLSGAGSEGLDLKGTRSIQLMEPHWNEARLKQVIGRGVRYRSHAHLPSEAQNVKVMRYHATPPNTLWSRIGKAVGSPASKSIDQYLHGLSQSKQELANQIGDALQEASDYGPLQTKAREKAAADYRLSSESLKMIFERTNA